MSPSRKKKTILEFTGAQHCSICLTEFDALSVSLSQKGSILEVHCSLCLTEFEALSGSLSQKRFII